TLSAAERDVHDRGLERHRGGEGRDLELVDLRVEPDPTLGRTTRDVVMHAPARVDLDGTVVEAHRDGDFERAGGSSQNALDVAVDTRDLRCILKLFEDFVPTCDRTGGLVHRGDTFHDFV